MLLREHARRQHFGGVARQHRHHGLRQDGPVVQRRCHLVHGDTRHFATRLNGPLVGVQTRKGRQQRRMNIEQAALKLAGETRRQDTHKARQHHQRRLTRQVKLRNQLRQGCVKRFARGKSFVVQRVGGNALLTRKHQTCGAGFVADDSGHAGAVTGGPVFALCGFHDGGHVGATA